MNDNDRLNQLNSQVAAAEAEIRFLDHQSKILARQEKELTRRQRTRRLCTRGAMLETFLKRPGDFTDDEVMELLVLAFDSPPVQKLLNSILARLAREDDCNRYGLV